MQKTSRIAMFLTFSALSVAYAQYPDTAGQGTTPAPSSLQAAPIVRSYPGAPGAYPGPYPGQARAAATQTFDSQPGSGVSVRSDVSKGVETVSSSSAITELRIVQGRADVTIHHPADHSQILVDLPGGQVSLLKDGLYTFNAATDTVRVLHGEAEAYAGARDAASKGIKVKETQQLAFFKDVKLKAVTAFPYELTADLLPGDGRGDGMRSGSYGDRYYGDYPNYAWGYGSPWGYGVFPYGYGYPFGVGFGYYGGFGGFRGGFRR